MTQPTMRIRKDAFDHLREYLEQQDFAFEERPYQVFLARKSGISVSLYENGKVVIQGRDKEAIENVMGFLQNLGAEAVEKPKKELPPLEVSGPRIGTDEVGKGDYFGPLVIVGVYVDEEIEAKLQALGVRNSKSLSDTTISKLAFEIRRLLSQTKRFEEVWINPLRYNILHKKLSNVNRILGWGHARVIENLLMDGVECDTVVADQFGDESHIQQSLMSKGKTVRLVQVPKAERDIAVAAASILARDRFLHKLEELRETYQMDFPKGATHVIDFGKKLVEMYGEQILGDVAKLHFRTTEQITGGVIPEITTDKEQDRIVERMPREPSEKDSDSVRLECYSLLSSFEKDLRKFIKKNLTRVYGDDWWAGGVRESIRLKCEKLAMQEQARGRDVEPLDCLDFKHYRYILTGKNWDVFGPMFKDQNQLLGRLALLVDVRNPVAHVRGRFGPKDKMDVLAAVRWLREKMGQKTLESYP